MHGRRPSWLAPWIGPFGAGLHSSWTKTPWLFCVLTQTNWKGCYKGSGVKLVYLFPPHSLISLPSLSLPMASSALAVYHHSFKLSLPICPPSPPQPTYALFLLTSPWLHTTVPPMHNQQPFYPSPSLLLCTFSCCLLLPSLIFPLSPLQNISAWNVHVLDSKKTYIF